MDRLGSLPLAVAVAVHQAVRSVLPLAAEPVEITAGPGGVKLSEQALDVGTLGHGLAQWSNVRMSAPIRR